METSKLYKRVKKVFDSYDLSSAAKEVAQIKQVGGQSARDIYDKDWGYYQFLACMVRVLKPIQIIELGGAWGTSALMMLSELPKESKLYTITLPEAPAYSYITEHYPNLVKIIGDDRDLSNFKCDLEKTDLWFIDSLHTKDLFTEELRLYSPFFKKGAVVLVDDIHIDPGYEEVWDSIKYDKLDISELHRPSGFGLIVI